MREELNTAEPDDKRELMIQIWYPASPSAKGNKAPYDAYPDIFEDGYSQALHMPKMLFKNLGLVKTHAVEGAELSDTAPRTRTPSKSSSWQVTGILLSVLIPDGRVVYFSPLIDSGYEYLDQLNKVWVGDAIFVLDQVEKLAKNDPDQHSKSSRE